jgi:hypothetical protein
MVPSNPSYGPKPEYNDVSQQAHDDGQDFFPSTLAAQIIEKGNTGLRL